MVWPLLEEHHKKISSGHNNAAGLVPIQHLSPPMFSAFKIGAPISEWSFFGSRELKANHRLKVIGRKSVIWPMPMEQCEMDWWRANILPGEDALVTIFDFEPRLRAWGIYNARIIFPEDAQFDGILWPDVRWEFVDLELI